RKYDRNTGRGGEDVAEQLKSRRRAIRRDTAHIPDDGALRVEIGRDDGQAPTLCVLGGDPGEHRSIDMLGDELAQRLTAEYPGAEENGLQARRREETLGDAARVKLTQQAVIGGTQESKGRDQRAGAHSRYNVNS